MGAEPWLPWESKLTPAALKHSWPWSSKASSQLEGPWSAGPCLWCSALYLLCWEGKVHILYRSLLWGAAHTEKATSVTSRAGNKSEERMMATGKKNRGQTEHRGEWMAAGFNTRNICFAHPALWEGRTIFFPDTHCWSGMRFMRPGHPTGPEHIGPSQGVPVSCPVKCPKSPLMPFRSELPSRQAVHLNLRMPFVTSSCSNNQLTFGNWKQKSLLLHNSKELATQRERFGSSWGDF